MEIDQRKQVKVSWVYLEQGSNALIKFLEDKLFKLALDTGVADFGQSEGLDDLGEIEETILTFDYGTSAHKFLAAARSLVKDEQRTFAKKLPIDIQPVLEDDAYQGETMRLTCGYGTICDRMEAANENSKDIEFVPFGFNGDESIFIFEIRKLDEYGRWQPNKSATFYFPVYHVKSATSDNRHIVATVCGVRDYDPEVFGCGWYELIRRIGAN